MSEGVPVRRTGRRVRIFGIDEKYPCWVGGRDATVGEGVGVKSDDGELARGEKSLDSSGVEGF